MFGLLKKKTRANKNDAVRAALAGYGDDGTRVRHVIHFAYPTRKMTASLEEAIDLIRSQADFDTVEHTEEQGGVRFEQHREVASADFDALTDRLEESLKVVGWEYDGWECAVETGENE